MIFLRYLMFIGLVLGVGAGVHDASWLILAAVYAFGLMKTHSDST